MNVKKYLQEYCELGHDFSVLMSQSGQKAECGVPHCRYVSPVLQEAKHCLLPVVPIQV